MSKKPVYKIIFYNQDKVYEVYAKSVHQGTMLGFIEIEQLIFGEKSSIVVDPSEEKLQAEFNQVARTYIPLHSVIRIDEVDRKGACKITDHKGHGNVTHLPLYNQGDKTKT